MKQEDLARYQQQMAEVRRGAPRGQWDSEPDRVEWREYGLPCLIVRGPSGALCGYVGVPAPHPAHGKDSGDVEVHVHGGLTYSSRCAGVICHVPEAGESDDAWWLGFDCNHSGDISITEEKWAARDGVRYFGHRFGYSYKHIEYVRNEVTSLARQLSELVK